MGRGLSDLQKRILVYAWDRRPTPETCGPFFGSMLGTSWFDGFAPGYKDHISEAILPGKWGQWTQADVASVSRALRRLERRGLVIRRRSTLRTDSHASVRRTMAIVLTPAGEAAVELIKAGKPVPLGLGKRPKLEADPSVPKVYPHSRPIPPGWDRKGPPPKP
jgi:hypothetical protein